MFMKNQTIPQGSGEIRRQVAYDGVEKCMGGWHKSERSIPRLMLERLTLIIIDGTQKFQVP
jgi:hypothetical protein